MLIKRKEFKPRFEQIVAKFMACRRAYLENPVLYEKYLAKLAQAIGKEE